MVDTPRADASLSSFFSDYMQKAPLFLNKDVFQGNYFPESINHRAEQLKQMAQVLAPLLRGHRPSNLFIYGKTGTGKTLCIKHLQQELARTSGQNNIPLTLLYLNCKLKRVADTEYRLIAQLSRDLGRDIPSTGLPTDEVYRIFYQAVASQGTPTLLVLDEVDQLIKKTGDGVLYNLLR